ncbi:uncharacterized protein LOC110344849 [Heterocephalus glaber]|uniref:Uncharacterized protein LOC110344849 n=1 Tax=Heterocephalus glaber TaxID=10181 RepID=A0AAX6RJ67_HETGA|nr:uncharacterized protein LOC110344849 [Heterocephalus glaber]
MPTPWPVSLSKDSPDSQARSPGPGHCEIQGNDPGPASEPASNQGRGRARLLPSSSLLWWPWRAEAPAKGPGWVTSCTAWTWAAAPPKAFVPVCKGAGLSASASSGPRAGRGLPCTRGCQGDSLCLGLGALRSVPVREGVPANVGCRGGWWDRKSRRTPGWNVLGSSEGGQQLCLRRRPQPLLRGPGDGQPHPGQQGHRRALRGDHRAQALPGGWRAPRSRTVPDRRPGPGLRGARPRLHPAARLASPTPALWPPHSPSAPRPLLGGVQQLGWAPHSVGWCLGPGRDPAMPHALRAWAKERGQEPSCRCRLRGPGPASSGDLQLPRVRLSARTAGRRAGRGGDSLAAAIGKASVESVRVSENRWLRDSAPDRRCGHALPRPPWGREAALRIGTAWEPHLP